VVIPAFRPFLCFILACISLAGILAQMRLSVGEFRIAKNLTFTSSVMIYAKESGRQAILLKFFKV
jgi:hypothetical protein